MSNTVGNKGSSQVKYGRWTVLHILTSVRALLAEDFYFQEKISARNGEEIKNFLMVVQACI